MIGSFFWHLVKVYFFLSTKFSATFKGQKHGNTVTKSDTTVGKVQKAASMATTATREHVSSTTAGHGNTQDGTEQIAKHFGGSKEASRIKLDSSVSTFRNTIKPGRCQENDDAKSSTTDCKDTIINK